MTKSYYDAKPEPLEKVTKSRWLYRWDIQEEITPMGEDVSHTSYSCNEIFVYNPVTSNQILERAITTLYGNNIEQKMLNDYNAANLGILDNSFIDKYKEFLNARKELKAQIESDCQKYNIK